MREKKTMHKNEKENQRIYGQRLHGVSVSCTLSSVWHHKIPCTEMHHAWIKTAMKYCRAHFSQILKCYVNNLELRFFIFHFRQSCQFNAFLLLFILCIYLAHSSHCLCLSLIISEMLYAQRNFHYRLAIGLRWCARVLFNSDFFFSSAFVRWFRICQCQ